MSLRSFVGRRVVAPVGWARAGIGVLLGTATAEVVHGGPLVVGVLVVVGVVVADTVFASWVRPTVGVLAASVAVGRALDGETCFAGDDTSESLAFAVVVGAFAWLIAVTTAQVRGASWISAGVNVLLLLFGFVELAVFIISPSGVPVVSVAPGGVYVLVLSCGAVVAVWGGVAPDSAHHAVGWILALAQLLIAIRLMATPWNDCANEAAFVASLALFGAVAAGVAGRLRKAR